MLSKPFATVLAAGRGHFNQRAMETRRRHPAFDQDAFSHFLRHNVDPLVGAVAAAAPERVSEVGFVAYDMALELIGLKLAGPIARSQLLSGVWRDLAPCFARLVATDPARVLGMLSNAALYLETLAGADPVPWTSQMAALAPRIESVQQLRAVGQVLAWRAGAAHFRAGAIEAAGDLPEALALAAFGAAGGGSWKQLRERMLTDIWWRPGADDAAAPDHQIGAFSGLGGQFAAPPEVRGSADGFVVRSAGRHSLLVVDACGAVLLSATPEEFDAAGETSRALHHAVEGRTLVVGTQRIALDLPAHGLVVCGTEAAIAITSPYTHAIRVLPRQ